MQEHSSGKVPLDDFAFGASPFQQFDQNQTGEIIGFSGISGIFEGALADGRYQLSQRSVDTVIATVCFHVGYPFTLRTPLMVARFSPRLSGDAVELFLDLLPVHHSPPIRNVLGSLVVVLEIIRVFPHIES